MNKRERIISIIMLAVISFSNVASPAAYAAEMTVTKFPIPGTHTDKTQFAPTPRFAMADTESVLGASTSLLTVGTQSLDLLQDTAASANKRIPVQVQKLAKKVYRTDEDVTLAVTNPDNEAFTTTVQDGTGQNVGVPITESNNGNTTTVDLAPSDSIKPGKYKIIVTDQNGKSTEQDFTWGVLALNTDKSMYHPGERADIAMAVLNDNGDMVCDASIALRIQNSALGINDTLSTENGKITISSQCQHHDYSLEPDYEGHYQFGDAGTYNLQLTATTKNGTHTITDSVQVTDQIPFDVQRVSATRIYPPNTYPMIFNVKANKDFTGTVTETVPDSFTITPATESATPVSSYGNMETVYLNSNDPAALMSQEIASQSGGLVMPFHGTYPITQGFGAQLTDPSLQAFYTQYGLAGHDGIDFGLPMDTPLYTVDDGTVIWSGPGDYGTMVTVLHSWGQTYYGHMSNTSVTVGEHVNKGQLIGYSGMSGEATGPHLHFGMKPLNPDIKNGYYGKVDPMPYLPIGQGQSVAALGASTNPVANAVYNTTVLGASDSAATPTPTTSSGPTVTPEVSPTAIPSILPTTPSASQSASPSEVTPNPTTGSEPSAQTQAPVQTATPPANTNITVLQKQILLDEQIANSALTEKVKIITWHVSLKKGESTSLGYDFQAPRVSPQFYLLGPAHFYDTSGKVVFEEQRQWQIASDDVGLEWYNETTGSPWNGYSWQYRKKLTIDHTKVTANSTTTTQTVGVDTSGSIDGSLPLSKTITLGSQSNKMLIAAYMQTTNTNTCAFNIDGNALTAISTHATSPYRNEIFYTTNQSWLSAGSHTLQMTVNSGCSALTAFGYVDFYNVNQTTPFSNVTIGGTSGADPTSDTITSTTSQLIFCSLAARGGGKNYTTFNGTLQYPNPTGSTNDLEGGTVAGGSPNTTCTWSGGGGAFNDILGLAVNPSTTTVSSDPTNFPVEVNLSNDANLKAHTATGTDILFTQSDGKTKLNHEIESYDPTTGSLTAWVNIPDLSPTTDTILYMYYGNPSAASQANATGTWNSNYVAVYHLGENAANKTISDSTSDGYTGTANQNTANTHTSSGEIDGAQTLNGTTDKIDIGDKTNLDFGSGSFSFYAWVNEVAGQGASFPALFWKGGAASTQQGYDLEDDSGVWKFHLTDNSSNTINAGNTVTAGSWENIAYVVDRTGGNIIPYLNGSAGTSTSLGSIGSVSNTLAATSIGYISSSNNFYWHGTIDEIEISNTALTAGWVQTEYNNQSAPGPGSGDFFSSIGNEETEIYAPTLDELLGHGEWFNSSGTKQPFVF